MQNFQNHYKFQINQLKSKHYRQKVEFDLIKILSDSVGIIQNQRNYSKGKEIDYSSLYFTDNILLTIAKCKRLSPRRFLMAKNRGTIAPTGPA